MELMTLQKEVNNNALAVSMGYHKLFTQFMDILRIVALPRLQTLPNTNNNNNNNNNKNINNKVIIIVNV